MSDLRENLIREFQDAEYRYAYAESFLNTKIAMQIKTLREQRGRKQAEVGLAIGTRQSGYSRFEDVNHSVWKTDTLWKVAKALDVRLNISFETFGSLIEEKERFSKAYLQRPDFGSDPGLVDKGENLAETAGQEARRESAEPRFLKEAVGDFIKAKVASAGLALVGNAELSKPYTETYDHLRWAGRTPPNAIRPYPVDQTSPKVRGHRKAS